MKKQLLISGGLAAIIALFNAGSTITAQAEIDLAYINQRIDNLEARTSNVESDVQQLQATTQTAPGAHAEVPPAPAVQTVISQPPAIQPAPQASPTPTATPSPTPFVPSVAVISSHTNADGTVTYTCAWQTAPSMTQIRTLTGSSAVCPVQP